MTTEFNTLFETVTAIAEQVDPVKLNQTLTATAEALTGLGNRFGESLIDANRILDDLNPRMPQIRYDTAGRPNWPTCTPTRPPTYGTGWSTR